MVSGVLTLVLDSRRQLNLDGYTKVVDACQDRSSCYALFNSLTLPKVASTLEGAKPQASSCSGSRKS